MTDTYGMICVLFVTGLLMHVAHGCGLHACRYDDACNDVHCDEYHEPKCVGVDWSKCPSFFGFAGIGRRTEGCHPGQCECLLKPCFVDTECRGLTCTQPHHAECQGSVTAGCLGGSGGCTRGQCHCV